MFDQSNNCGTRKPPNENVFHWFGFTCSTYNTAHWRDQLLLVTNLSIESEKPLQKVYSWDTQILPRRFRIMRDLLTFNMRQVRRIPLQ